MSNLENCHNSAKIINQYKNLIIIHKEPTRQIFGRQIATRAGDHRRRDNGYSTWRGDCHEGYGKGGSCYNGERRFNRSHPKDCVNEEEPEWISGGPSSQSETIELVGFEELEKTEAKITNEVYAEQPKNKIEVTNKDSFYKVTANVPVGDKSEENGEINDKIEHSENGEKSRGPTPGFDFNEIFQTEHAPEIIVNYNTEELKPNIPLENSRFSSWFQNLTKGVGSQHSYFQSELVVNMLEDSSDASFLPVSHSLPQNLFQDDVQVCQNSSCTAPQYQQCKPREDRNILDILKNANINVQPFLNGDTSEMAILKQKELAQKARSVEEIEADLKQLVLGDKDKEKEKICPLYKLLTQLRTDGNSPPTISLGPLDLSTVLQEADTVGAMKSESHTNPALTQMLQCVPRSFQDTQEIDKSLQVLNQTTLNILNVKEDETLCSLSDKPAEQDLFGNIISSAEFIKNNKHHTLQAQDSEDKELLSVLLSPLSSYCHDSSSKHSLVLSPRQSPLLFDGHCRISSPLVFRQHPPVLTFASAPIHPNEINRKFNPLQTETGPVIPCLPLPQKHAVHTQFIWQNSLIKYNLIEQEEKHEKLEESQRTQSPNNPLSMNNSSPPKGMSPTVAAFTPTSVIRKVHDADKLDKTSIKPEFRNGVGELQNVSDVALRSCPSNRDQQLIQGDYQFDSNLAKWFGSEMLKEKLPEMPPVLLQRAVLVEELERQQRGHSLEN
ncbi:uncharacterized protein LOC143241028 isoform X2 [Tachypleus tridentatus]|uniref:uncharacterized protein LOC143241028 isoform X2 n=1 Tax=Tachypleus tridentatus TaxID=6853 RepID=UPI003FD0C2D7